MIHTARKRAIAASSTWSRVSVCTIRPPSMTRIRSAISRTKLSTCSQTTMQMLRMLRISRSSRAEILDDRRLDAFGRLVEQQHLRVAGERARDRQLLLLAAGQIAAAPLGKVGQDRKQFENLIGDFALAGDHQPGLDVLLDRHGAENLPPLRDIGEPVGDALVARQAR